MSVRPVPIAERIDLLRFLLIVGLVFLHYGTFPGSQASPFAGFTPSTHPVATFVNAFNLFVFLSAVPLQSMISGWLFFKGADFSPAFYLRLYRRRARSILFPMVTWNLLIFALSLGIFAIDRKSVLLDLIRYDMSDLGPQAVLNALLGITRHPINFQFWFLRDLLLTILVSPLLGLALRRLPILGLLFLFAVWIGDYTLGIFFRTDVLFFFYLGGYVRVHNVRLPEFSPRATVALVLFFAMAAAARTLAPVFLDTESPDVAFLLGVATRLMRIVGVLSFWAIAPFLLPTSFGRLLVSFGPLAFFLHALHWPLNQFIKLALASLIPGDGSPALLLNYFLTTLLTISAAVLLAMVMSRHCPAVFDHLSGGRSGLFASRGRAAAS
jgi:succinoglycan biosynthesis protein ExoH